MSSLNSQERKTSADTITQGVDDQRIRNIHPVKTPAQLIEDIALSNKAIQTVIETRNTICDILNDRDQRMLLIMGPCSIHDPNSALEYAHQLKSLIDQYQEDLVIIMRVYFEKPRTVVGWKGLINDPDLDESFNINKGLAASRALLLSLNEIGVACGSEYLDVLTPQYNADLISWAAIGARTTESQLHREMASGLSCPVGFKNGTQGNMQICVDALRAARHPHRFLSSDKLGNLGIFETAGNQDCHVIMRGGTQPNFDSASVNEMCNLLKKADQSERIMIDCSHSNSMKQFKRQLLVAKDIHDQIINGEDRIFGIMVESNLKEGTQKIIPDQPLVYGRSITDPCIGWEDTLEISEILAKAAQIRRKRQSS